MTSLGARQGPAPASRTRSHADVRHLLGALVPTAATAALVAAVAWRAADHMVGLSLPAAFSAVAAELPVTVPAAILVAAAMALDVAAGAGVLRLVRRRPFATWTDAVLAGLATSVVLDVALLSVLGGPGLFRIVLLVPMLTAAVVAGLLRRPFCRARPHLPRIGLAHSLLVAAAWSTVLLLSLASPVVPATDVLPNHVAPAEHLRAFGSIATLATYPSPIYGPSRLFLGYEALFGTLSVLTGVRATLVVAVSAVWLAVVTVLAAQRLATAAFGRGAGHWAPIAILPTFTFVRLVDVRDSVTALPIAAVALAVLAGSHVRQGRRQPGDAELDWVLTAALTAAALVHPLVGTLTALTVVLATLGDRGRLRHTAPALLATGVALLPQLALMTGHAPAPIVAVLALAAAVVVAIVTARIPDRPALRLAIARANERAWSRRRLAVVITLVAAGLLVAGSSVVATAIGWVNPHFPLLFASAAVVLAGAVSASRSGRLVVAAGVAAGLALLLAAAVLPADGILGQSVHYEVQKAVGYWLPWVCAPALAAVLAMAARLGKGSARWSAATAVLLGLILLPTASMAPDAAQASQPTADVAVSNLRAAELGYFQGFPDARVLVGARGVAVDAFLQRQIVAGRFRPTDRLLHIAPSYEPWANVPVAVLDGVDETVVSLDAAPTIFTAGGRIDPMTALAGDLHDGFDWVLLEPGGLPAATRERILDAGYRSVFAVDGAEIFVTPSRAAGS